MSRRQRGEAPPGDLSYQKGIGGIAGEVDCKEEHFVGRSRREKVASSKGHLPVGKRRRKTTIPKYDGWSMWGRAWNLRQDGARLGPLPPRQVARITRAPWTAPPPWLRPIPVCQRTPPSRPSLDITKLVIILDHLLCPNQMSLSPLLNRLLDSPRAWKRMS